jgi:NAD(P)-dependent dehydrogenase (short-subunit alcohol dehydrogenase family)
MSDPSGQVVLVTGGGTGIGQAIARQFVQQKAKVASAGRREEPLRQTADHCATQGTLHWRTCDVTDLPSVRALVQWVEQTLGPITILVNAAGINIKNRSMAAMDPEDWDRVMRINATGAYYVMSAVLPSMRSRGNGLIVNISSISGKRALALGGIAYCASKFAMSALGTAVGDEVADQGIRVTNVYPGEVDTPILQQRPQSVSQEHRQRILRPDDVAQLVVAISRLPGRAHVPEVVIKPLVQHFV